MMRKIRATTVLCLLVLSLSLAACGGYTQIGAKSTSHQGMNGGDVTVEISKASGASTQKLETSAGSGLEMDVDVTLAVGKGSYKLELLGKNDQVTLSLEAHDGQTVTGQGQMVTDAFGDASYRVTALEAENVAYALQYAFR
jgi:hypothetical protein